MGAKNRLSAKKSKGAHPSKRGSNQRKSQGGIGVSSPKSAEYGVTVRGELPSNLVERVSLLHANAILRKQTKV